MGTQFDIPKGLRIAWQMKEDWEKPSRPTVNYVFDDEVHQLGGCRPFRITWLEGLMQDVIGGASSEDLEAAIGMMHGRMVMASEAPPQAWMGPMYLECAAGLEQMAAGMVARDAEAMREGFYRFERAERDMQQLIGN